MPPNRNNCSQFAVPVSVSHKTKTPILCAWYLQTVYTTRLWFPPHTVRAIRNGQHESAPLATATTTTKPITAPAATSSNKIQFVVPVDIFVNTRDFFCFINNFYWFIPNEEKWKKKTLKGKHTQKCDRFDWRTNDQLTNRPKWVSPAVNQDIFTIFSSIL